MLKSVIWNRRKRVERDGEVMISYLGSPLALIYKRWLRHLAEKELLDGYLCLIGCVMSIISYLIYL